MLLAILMAEFTQILRLMPLSSVLSSSMLL